LWSTTALDSLDQQQPPDLLLSTYLIRKLTARDSSLSAASQRRLLQALSAPESIQAGHTFVAQGSRPSRCIVVISGWAARCIMLPDGRRQTLALHIAGDFVDLHSFPIKIMDHSVEALTPCSIAGIDHSAVLEITEQDPHLTRLLWLHTLVDAAILRQWLLSSGTRSSIEHAAHFFCELFTRLRVAGLAAAGQPFDLPLSQQDVGDSLGISAVHVSRTMKELRHRKLFAWRNGRAEVLDWPGLQQLAQFDPTYLSLRDEPR
jgi:CRP-like cAMP-binding protein